MKLVIMEFIFFACFLFSALLSTPSASLHIQVQSSYNPGKKEQVLEPSRPTFPRKLRINEQVSAIGRAISDSKSNNRQKENDLGEKDQINKEQQVVAVLHGSKGSTRQDHLSTMEGTDDKSNLFTMDYSGVRRRRPIHNKSVPVLP